MLRPQRGRVDRAEQQVQTGELEGVWRGPFTSSSEHTTKCAQCHSHHTQTTLSFYLKKDAFCSIVTQDATSQYQSVTRLEQMQALNK